MSDVENSDDERYANESFENESDNEIPEIAEIESETTENSDDDLLPSVKINTGPIKRVTHRLSATRNTDTIPFASSSDEEDDVIVGQTLAEINTPSMHFEEQLNTTTSIRSSRSILQENNYRLQSVKELQESSNEFIDENEEQEFQKIKEMEERYMQQNSDKIPQNTENNINNNSMVDDEEKYLTTDDEYEVEEAETETDNEPVWEQEPATEDENASEDEQQNHNVHSTESNESFMGNNFQQPNNLNSTQNDRSLESSSNENLPLDHANLMQMIQNSLESLKTSSDTNENSLAVTGEVWPVNGLMSNDPAALFNPQNIAMALVKAIKSSSLTTNQSLTNAVTELREDNEEKNIHDTMESDKQNNDLEQENSVVESGDYDEDDNTEKGDDEIEEIQNTNGQICELDYDDDIYYNSQLDYRITSKTPSSFNSDDYLFHANFIKPFYRSKLTDNLRVKPQPRKSMSFSNERMREIERHNQILLRKIITQKPTYTAKNQRAQPFIQKLPSQTNLRPTTSAVNRKKQQRQIDMDNQVLKRKIEAISLRRRPLIS